MCQLNKQKCNEYFRNYVLKQFTCDMRLDKFTVTMLKLVISKDFLLFYPTDKDKVILHKLANVNIWHKPFIFPYALLFMNML